MSHARTQQSVLFPELFGKRVVAQFDQPHGSSDGGALLFKTIVALATDPVEASQSTISA